LTWQVLLAAGTFVGVGVEDPEPQHRAEFDRLAIHYTVEPKARVRCPGPL
jgi:hypothetical protein